MLQRAHLRTRVGIQRHGNGAGGDLTGLDLSLGKADRGDLRAGKDRVSHGLQAQRRDAFTKRVVHRHTALHRGHGGKREKIGAVTGCVNAGNIGARDAVYLDVTRLRGFHAHVFQLQILGIRDGTNGHDDVRAVNLAPVLRGHQHVAVLGAVNGFHAAVLFKLHAALAQHGFEDVGGIGIIMRQDAIARGHHRNFDAQLSEGGDKLGTGDTGPHHNEVLRQLGKVIYLLPGQDALAIRLGAGQNAWGGAGSHQDEVRIQRLLVSILIEDRGDLVPTKGIGLLILREVRAAIDNAGAQGIHGIADITGLLSRQVLHALVQRTDGKLRLADALVQLHVIRAAQVRFNIGAGDEGLGGNTVQDHAIAAHALVFDDGDFRAVLGASQRCLIARRATADDDNSLGLVQHAIAPL